MGGLVGGVVGRASEGIHVMRAAGDLQSVAASDEVAKNTVRGSPLCQHTEDDCAVEQVDDSAMQELVSASTPPERRQSCTQL